MFINNQNKINEGPNIEDFIDRDYEDLENSSKLDVIPRRSITKADPTPSKK